MFFFSFQFIDTAATNCSKFSLVVVELLANLLHCASCFANFKGILGFSVLSIISVGAELMPVTMQYAHPAWPAKTKQRMVKEIVMVTGIFVKRRRKTLLYSRK